MVVYLEGLERLREKFVRRVILGLLGIRLRKVGNLSLVLFSVREVEFLEYRKVIKFGCLYRYLGLY